jgi:hypothetical protein
MGREFDFRLRHHSKLCRNINILNAIWISALGILVLVRISLLRAKPGCSTATKRLNASKLLDQRLTYRVNDLLPMLGDGPGTLARIAAPNGSGAPAVSV